MFDNEVKTFTFNPGEVIVVKIDTDRYDLESASELYTKITSRVPDHIPVIGIPVGVELDVESINYLIKQLEEMKNDLLC